MLNYSKTFVSEKSMRTYWTRHRFSLRIVTFSRRRRREKKLSSTSRHFTQQKEWRRFSTVRTWNNLISFPSLRKCSPLPHKVSGEMRVPPPYGKKRQWWETSALLWDTGDQWTRPLFKSMWKEERRANIRTHSLYINIYLFQFRQWFARQEEFLCRQQLPSRWNPPWKRRSPPGSPACDPIDLSRIQFYVYTIKCNSIN